MTADFLVDGQVGKADMRVSGDAEGTEHERVKLPALDEGLGLTSHCMAASSLERVVLATAEGVGARQFTNVSAGIPTFQAVLGGLARMFLI